MDCSPLVKLADLIEKFQFIRHKTRRSFACLLIEGLVRGRSVVFSELAYPINKDIKPASIERRIQDFFKRWTLITRLFYVYSFALCLMIKLF